MQNKGVFMKVNFVGKSNLSFGYKNFLKGLTQHERTELLKAFGLDRPQDLKDWAPQFGYFGNDIISGRFLPKISITAKGCSPMQALKNAMRIELAKIRKEKCLQKL